MIKRRKKDRKKEERRHMTDAVWMKSKNRFG